MGEYEEQFEEKAIKFLEIGDYSSTEYKIKFLEAVGSFVEIFAQAIKDNKDVYTENCKKALKICSDSLILHCKKWQEEVDWAVGKIAEIDREEAKIENYNQGIRAKRFPLEEEKAKLGILQGARKREIEEELSGLRLEALPKEKEKQRAEWEDYKKEYENKIKPFGNFLKTITYYENIAKQKSGESFRELLEKKKEISKNTYKAPEPLLKAPEAPESVLTFTSLKEVHKPNIKPLKELGELNLRPLKEVPKPKFKPLKKI